MSGIEDLLLRFFGRNPVVHGLVGGVVITVFNTVGALLVLVWPSPSQRVLDGALGFAAGAMIYVISGEIVPETHRKGHARVATLGLMIGVMVMLYLDVSLG